ncbi:peptidoglycan-binding domain-containing protein [Tindallia californiensis]|uniref:Peptidoglycan-binding (PGRP) domain of peptidoglycan hydrolases-containing protein n=1 Tax=Tindallia californiensis TaxID=159292 RepID=A0A1H3MG15_9FIRM|nr:peptidoglycan-binding protein [Tindallia californiensis]SDY75630.1 Peptidoglycan-binding (PGRP) domain of peptidoglycan hydrolases-containing protein [Tindallia californiensis]
MFPKKSIGTLSVLILLTIAVISLTPVYAYSEGVVLRYEMENHDVLTLQKDLSTLGFFHVAPTGYFGSLTKEAVKDFQKSHGLVVDGLAGPTTLRTVQNLATTSDEKQTVSRGSQRSRESSVKMLSWFDEVKPLWNRGENAVITDVATGLRFNVQRTYGRNHADVETLTKEDTRILREAIGGSWSWERRPVIVEIKGHRIAASLAPMPHAGVDGLPTNETVNNRSGGFGRGTNLNAVHGNGMDGHMDIHFQGSRTHGSNSTCSDHQRTVERAYRSGS